MASTKHIACILFLICLPILCNCQFSDLINVTAEDVTISNCDGINTDHLELSPVFYGNGVVYLSTKLESGQKDKNIGESFLEIFYADMESNGQLIRPRRFSVELSSNFHEGPLCFNPEQNVIYFTRNNISGNERKKDDQGVTRLKIFQANKGDFDWERIRELPFNNDQYSTCHPTYVAEEKFIIFASNMPGGYGGMDLWISRYESNNWSSPSNLGPAINTEAHDVFPVIHSNGLLLFASSEKDGHGGLDIYASAKVDGSWQERVCLPEPINSSADDLSLILNHDHQSGYITSSRLGGKGKDDIYLIKSNKPIFHFQSEPREVEIEILSSENERPIFNAEVFVMSVNNNSLYYLDGTDSGLKVHPRMILQMQGFHPSTNKLGLKAIFKV